MTSSLVGSEMCIRDSSLTHSAVRSHFGSSPRRHTALRWVVSWARGAAGTAPRGAVSYTHLTLPTICSV
eukprot:9598329-Prorocentrum_lima.AAC.1